MLAVAGCALLIGAASTRATTISSQEHIIDGVTCPESSFCAAYQIGGTDIQTADPSVDSTWSATNVVDAGITALSCPSAAFCAAVDNAGDVVTSGDAGSPTPTWRIVHVDGNLDSRDAGTRDISLEGISCPSASLCVAVDQQGNVLTSTEPAGDSDTWHKTKLNGTNQFDAISCAPNSTLCAAVDMDGNLSVSSQANGGAATWHTVSLDPAMNFSGVSCAGVDFCMAVDYEWRVFTSTEPANPNSWRMTGSIPTPAFYAVAVPSSAQPVMAAHASGATTEVSADGENILSCPSDDFCAIPSYHTQEVWTTNNPASNPSTWTGTRPQQMPEESEETVMAVGCASPQLCVGGDWFGEGLVSRDPVGGSTAWPTTLAAASLPSASPRLLLSGPSLRGTIKRLGRASWSAVQAKARLRFTLTAPPATHRLFGARFSNWTRYTKVRGGYEPNYNSFTVSGSRHTLARSIQVTSNGHPVAFSAKEETEDDVAIYLKRPASSLTVTISNPALQFTPQVVDAVEHHRQTPVRMLIEGWNEIGGGREPQFLPRFKTSIKINDNRSPAHRGNSERHHS